jgi:hypothetical protein
VIYAMTARARRDADVVDAMLPQRAYSGCGLSSANMMSLTPLEPDLLERVRKERSAGPPGGPLELPDLFSRGRALKIAGVSGLSMALLCEEAVGRDSPSPLTPSLTSSTAPTTSSANVTDRAGVEEAGRARVDERGGMLSTAAGAGTVGIAWAVEGVAAALLPTELPAELTVLALAEDMSRSALPAPLRVCAAADEAMDELPTILDSSYIVTSCGVTQGCSQFFMFRTLESRNSWRFSQQDTLVYDREDTRVPRTSLTRATRKLGLGMMRLGGTSKTNS